MASKIPHRSNQNWILALTEQDTEAQREAIQDLYSLLVHAALISLETYSNTLVNWSPESIKNLAEDKAQEALLEIRDHLSWFKGESKFTTWAYRFVAYRVASELRRQRYKNLSPDQLLEDELAAFQSSLLNVIEPEHLAERTAYFELLHELIDAELGERQRIATVGVHWLGYSMDEIASMIGLTRNALYILLYDARKRLKAQLLARHLTLGDFLAAFED